MEPAFGSRPLLNTIPGECPAQVFIPTTSGRFSLPLLASVEPETPVEPVLRDGSGGAFFSASKSPAETAGCTWLADCSAPAHLRIAAPWKCHAVEPTPARITIVIKSLANGVNFMRYSPMNYLER